MLINPIKENDVLGIKLVGGDEIIAKMVSQTDTTITVVRPLSVTLIPAHNGGANVAFVPWTLSMPDGGEITLQRSNILAYAAARQDAAASYIKQTTGLEIPEAAKGLII